MARPVRVGTHVFSRLDLPGAARRPVGAQPRNGRAGCAERCANAGATETMLKWPNDVVWRHRKLGGLLIQLQLEAGGAASIVVGLGLNVALPADARERLATSGAAPVADLREASGGDPPGRNALAGRLVNGDLRRPRRSSGARVSRRSRLVSPTFDSLAGELVCVSQAAGSVEGRACGADRDGALRSTSADASSGSRRRRDVRSGGGCDRMMLLVDIGNSRVKWATLRSAASWRAQSAAAYSQLDHGRLAPRAVRSSPASTRVIVATRGRRGRLPRCSPRRRDSRPASRASFRRDGARGRRCAQCLSRAAAARRRPLARGDRRTSPRRAAPAASRTSVPRRRWTA